MIIVNIDVKFVVKFVVKIIVKFVVKNIVKIFSNILLTNLAVFNSQLFPDNGSIKSVLSHCYLRIMSVM